jgi:acyl-CoA reductase-like NAD-dependent aldehyde dehydrogenase
MGTVPRGSSGDVDHAVRAALAAQRTWGRSSLTERAHYLERVRQGLNARVDEIARTVSLEVGTPIANSVSWQAQQPVHVTGLYAKLLGDYQPETRLANSTIIREPVGVVACITPWNFPLHQIMLKVAPALAAGCTVILKPSGLAPFSAFILADVVEQAGLPPGVFNLVSGSGADVGEALASHESVQMVSFTGSTRAGRRISALGAESVKRITLELGGKSASVVLPDADLDKAVRDSVDNCYANGGQTCAAWTRLLVPRQALGRAEAVAVATAEAYSLGDPLDPRTTMGPLVSAEQRSSVQDLIRAAVNDGAKLLTGGAEPPAGLDRGYFVKPTVFSDVRPAMPIARNEVFGPVMSILPYDSEEEAIDLANDSIYGLSGAVWSADPTHALNVARQIRTGQVFINGAPFNYLAPFGGFGQSGIGREFGVYGLNEYTELKSIQLEHPDQNSPQ